MGCSGKTSSTSNAAVSAIRRAPQLGQNPRRLQLKAASRVILSVHYASDVVAGLIIGAFWLLSGFALTEYLREHR